jgi:hypothetical protein
MRVCGTDALDWSIEQIFRQLRERDILPKLR